MSKKLFSLPLLLFIGFLVTGFFFARFIQTASHHQGPGARNSSFAVAVTQVSAVKSSPDKFQQEKPADSPGAQPAVSKPEGLPDDMEVAQDNSSQRNVLLIGVDSLTSPDPVLEYLWLAVYVPRSTKMIFLPVFPRQPGASHSGTDQRFAKSFSLDGDGMPAGSFLAALHDRKIWWSGTIITDRTGLTTALALSQPQESNSLVDQQTLVDFSSAGDNPESAFWAQTQLLQVLCENLVRSRAVSPTGQIDEFVTQHLRTDLDYAQIINDWLVMRAQASTTCEFPTLGLAAALP